MTTRRAKFLPAILCLASVAPAQGPLDPASLLKPLGESWPSYSGDYTGRRYSSLTQINQSNVKTLTLAWLTRLSAGGGGASVGFGGRGFGGGPPTVIGGEGPDATLTTQAGAPRVGGSILQVNGILYLSAPDNAWAIDARDGRVLWHFFWKTKGGTHIGNRGLGMWGNWLYLETPDDYLVSLDARTGKERWHKEIADFSEQYFSTPAPMVVGNHILVGTGDDLDAPGFLQAFDPETGALQWKFYTVPMKPGDPGLNTWPSLDAAQHGGAQPWIPGAYDPETRLYIFPTGNPTPAYTTGREGDDLYTCSLVAVDVDTGKMKWYYQTSPHDTHDWDSTQTPIMVDGTFNGRQRKLLLQATRNGYFFVIDRVTGEHLLTTKYSAANWALDTLDKNGAPKRNPDKDPIVAGALVSPTNGGSTNWPPAAYSPDTGLFYVRQNDGFAMYYLTERDPRGAMGLGGKEEDGVGSLGSYITAIDYKTGKIAWRHETNGGRGGLLTTAGKLLFGGDGSNIVAYDVATGKPLWHSRIGAVSNAPETYLLDGHQYLLTMAGDTLFAFTIY